MSPNARKVVPLYPEQSQPTADLPRCQVLKLHRERVEQGQVTTEMIIAGDFKPLWGEILRSLVLDALACVKARVPAKRSARHV